MSDSPRGTRSLEALRADHPTLWWGPAESGGIMSSQGEVTLFASPDAFGWIFWAARVERGRHLWLGHVADLADEDAAIEAAEHWWSERRDASENHASKA